MSRLVRYLVRLIYSLIALVLLVATTATIILTTEGGTRLAFYAAQQVAPGELAYTRVQGTLLRDLTIEDFSYAQDDLDLTVDHLHFRWRPWTMLNQQVHIRELSVQGIRLTLPAGETATEPTEPYAGIELPDIELPLAIRLDRVQIQDFALNQGEWQQEVDRFQLKAHTADQTIQLASLVLVTPEGQLQLHGELQPQGNYPLRLQSLVRTELPEYGMVIVEGLFSGNLEELRLNQTAVGPLLLSAEAGVQNLLSANPSWQAELRLQQATAYPLLPELERLRLDFSGSGDLSKVSGRLHADGRYTGIGDFQAELVASYRDEQVTLGELQLNLPEHELHTALTGKTDFDLTANEFVTELEAFVQFRDYPSVDLNLAADGNLEQAENLQLTARSAGSEVQLAGQLSWLPTPVWELELQAAGRQLEHWHPDLAGELDLLLQTQGRWDEEPDVNLQLAELTGDLFGLPVAGQGDLHYFSEQLEIDNFELRSGDSYLQATGQLSETLLNLDLSLQTGDLTARLLDLHGELSARAQLAGSPTKPRGSVQIDTRELRWQDWRVSGLALELDLDSTLDQLPVGQLELAELEFPAELNQPPVEHLQLVLSQEDQQHWTRLNLEHGDVQLATMAQGIWQEQQWSGQLEQFEVLHPLAGHWQLSQPAALIAGAEGASVPGLCLTMTSELPAELCLSGDWHAANNDFQAAVRGVELDYNLFATWLPEQLEASGHFSLFAEASQADDELTYAAGIDLSESFVTLPEQDIELTMAPSELLRVSGNLEELKATLELLSADLEGGLTAQLDIRDLLTEPTVAGDLAMDFTNLSFISLLTPELQEISGRFGGELQFNGSLTEPVITGGLALEEGAADVPAAGIRLRQVAASITAPEAPGEPFMMSAQAASDEGEVRIGGSYLLSTHEARFQVTGNNFLAMDTRDVELRISPDMQLTFLPDSLRIRGGVTIPQALIRPPDIETVDNSSRDTIVIYGDDEIADLEGGPQLPVNMDLQVTLGNDVRVSAFGFEGRLQGRLRVIEQPGQETSGVGTINVASGQYEIYGQNLDIERGSFSFTGGPIVNPGLDLRVSRRFDTDNITVGARVGGSLREPTLNLFSTPTLQDSTILSYLILGRAPGRGSPGEQNMLAQASMALGMRGGNFIGEQLSDALGVDEVSLDATGDSFDSASLYIGKHLSSRLYVKYGVGLVEPVSTFFIRYRLTEHLNFETQTGSEHSGADLFYTLER